MKTLISPLQVLHLAFGSDPTIRPEQITEADIAGAEQQRILPVIGQALYEKLLQGAYAPFRDEYLAAPTALYTRLAVQPRLDLTTGACGTTAPCTQHGRPAANEPLRTLRRALRAQARTLLQRAREYLIAHREQFPEYDPDNDILNHCTTHGGLVQIH